ncbi:MAG: hypothetical protein ABW194_06585 [Novosphingobium sp.]
MRFSLMVLAGCAGLALAVWSALALVVQALAVSTVPEAARGLPGAAAMLATLNRLEPWAAFALLVTVLGALAWAAWPDRAAIRDGERLAELSEQIGWRHEEMSAHVLALRDDLRQEVAKAAAELDERICGTLRQGLEGQDRQLRKTLDHFNARAGWQIQQLSARLEGLPVPPGVANDQGS